MEAGSTLNTLDYIFLVTILLSGVLAAMRGFVRELVTLVAWVGAWFAGTLYYKPMRPIADQFVKAPLFAEWAARGLMFLLSLIVLLIAGHFVCKLIKGQVLTTIDRSMGFLFGLARGALIISIIYLGAVLILWPDIDADPDEQAKNKDRYEPPALLVKAKTRPVMAFGANLLMPFVPKDMVGEELRRAEATRKKDFLLTPSKEDSADEDEDKGPVDVDKLFKQENE